jgi:hypothetical protein
MLKIRNQQWFSLGNSKSKALNVFQTVIKANHLNHLKAAA